MMIKPHIIEKFKDLLIDDYGIITVGNNGTIIGKKGVFTPNNSNSKKYYRVHIGNHHMAVHRLVAQAFIPNSNNYEQVNHINGNKNHNYVENLEWCNNQQNITHAVLNNLSAAKITFDDAKKIREIYATGQYTYSDISKIYNIGIPMISNIINKKNWNY